MLQKPRVPEPVCGISPSVFRLSESAFSRVRRVSNLIADLGFSVILTDKVAYRKTKLGTMCWMSPEIAKGESYGSEVDVWAFGCFAFELTYGEPPFYNLVNDSKAFLEAINTRNVDRIPEQYSDSFNDFV